MNAFDIIPATLNPTARERRVHKAKVWREEIDMLRARRSHNERVSLGPVGHEKHKSGVHRLRSLRDRILSVDIQAWFEAVNTDASYENWSKQILRWIQDGLDAPLSASGLSTVEQSLDCADAAISRLLDRHKWRNPLFRQELPDLLRNARSASERRVIMQRMATPPWADAERIKDIYRERIEVERRTGIKHHVDHIVPIMGRRVCGLHIPENLRVIPATDNLRKSNSHVSEL